eukprot:3244411-Pyramimonas_sp.AAC.1
MFPGGLQDGPSEGANLGRKVRIQAPRGHQDGSKRAPRGAVLRHADQGWTSQVAAAAAATAAAAAELPPPPPPPPPPPHPPSSFLLLP